MSNNFEVTGINVYPIAGCQPAKVDQIDIHGGPSTQYLVIDDKGTYLSRDEAPQLSRVKVLAQDDTYYAWDIKADSGVRLKATQDETTYDDPERDEVVHHHEAFGFQSDVTYREVSKEVSEWFSGVVEKPVKLAEMRTIRNTGLIAATEASVGHSPIIRSLTLPNLIISGTGVPYEEDEWRQIRIGEGPASFLFRVSQYLPGGNSGIGVLSEADQSTVGKVNLGDIVHVTQTRHD